MSNLTDFFPSGGGGDSAIVTDPNKLPKIIIDSGGFIKRDVQRQEINQNTGYGRDAIQNYGVWSNVIGSDTYNTIVDVTGSGYLYWCISSTQQLSSNDIVTIKITVDGVATEISGTINSRASNSGDRLFIGAYSQRAQGTSTTGYNGYNGSSDGGYRSDNRTSFPTNGIDRKYDASIISTDAFQFPGMPKLRFETSLKVEAKIGNYEATFIRFAAAAYKLD
jgi:hypothetical protein